MISPVSTYATLFLSFVLLVGSFFYMGTKKDIQGRQVMGLKDSKEILVPEQSSIVSRDELDNTKRVTYITRLTRDQILYYYKELGVLKGWEQVGAKNYTHDGKTITIKIEKESEDKNLVTFEYK